MVSESRQVSKLQTYKTRPKEFGALEFSAGNGKISFSIGMVSARGACPCLLIQTKQQPLVLRAEAKGGNQGYGFKAALLTLLGMGSRKRAHDEWDPRQWHMRCG